MNVESLTSSVFTMLLVSLPVSADLTVDSIEAPYEQCGFCHEADGNSRMPLFPRLAGQKPAYIIKQLRDYRSGKRMGRMQATAELLNDDDIFSVAEYFSQQSIKRTQNKTQSENDAVMAKNIFFKGDPERGLQSCVSCHGSAAQGLNNIPLLAGQHEKYLFEQIVSFKSGERTNDEDGQMQRVSRLLNTKEIQVLVSFLAKLTAKGVEVKHNKKQ